MARIRRRPPPQPDIFAHLLTQPPGFAGSFVDIHEYTHRRAGFGQQPLDGLHRRPATAWKHLQDYQPPRGCPGRTCGRAPCLGNRIRVQRPVARCGARGAGRREQPAAHARPAPELDVLPLTPGKG